MIKFKKNVINNNISKVTKLTLLITTWNDVQNVAEALQELKNKAPGFGKRYN